MPAGSFLAIDWGATNRRVYLMDAAGAVLDTARDDRGIRAIAAGGWSAELAGIRARFGDLPTIAAGMVGSTRGWIDKPYVTAPAGLAELAAGLGRVDGEDFAIVPGVAWRGDRPDVMRGEEVQALGAVQAGLAPADALFCQPGTHNKWITLDAGRITRFTTAITVELFALLRDHSILAEMMTGDVAGRTVQILSDPKLGPLYAAAVAHLGGTPMTIDGQAAFLAGIHHIRSLSL